ncbi:hypothetical protein QTP88_008623 [Uroleucon formosanum]
MTTYQPEVGGEYRTGYLKTLIKTKELHKDLEKMEFLSTVLTNPDLKFYATSDTVQKVDRNHKVPSTQPLKRLNYQSHNAVMIVNTTARLHILPVAT